MHFLNVFVILIDKEFIKKGVKMDRFFSMDNKFFTFMGKVADLLYPDRDGGGIDHRDVFCYHEDGKERRVLHN